jgi:integrase
MKKKFEAIQIRRWIDNNIRFDAKSVGGGLYLRYRETDRRPIWFLRFKIAKIEQRLIIGRYPDMTLADAWKKAAEHRLKIIAGFNPAEENRRKKQKTRQEAIAAKSAQNVSDLVDEYFTRHVDGAIKSARGRRLSINKYLIPAIGKLRIEDVKPKHIDAMLLGIVKAGAPTIANDVLTWSKQLFNYAVKRHIITYNPAAAFDFKDAGGKEKSRDRYLTYDELVKLFAVMRQAEKFTEHHYKSAKLLLLLGCRKGELFKARRSEFDLANSVWHMPADNKTESAIDVPLSKPVLEIVADLIKIQIDDNEFLFPTMGSRRSRRGHIDQDYLNKPIQNFIKPLMGEIENFTIHDFRATMKTHMCSKALGIDRFVTERCLNHKIPGMDGVYDRGDYFEERKAALDAWAAFVESAEIGAAWNVTPIRKSR